MSKLTHYIECNKFNTWIVKDLNKQLVYIGTSRNNAIKWAFSQNKENRKVKPKPIASESL
jgi:hypothetical protein|tara:strand:+ start:751 stop:930 length:180 start_codon:yes stop_codon:yes gene_type:complete